MKSIALVQYGDPLASLRDVVEELSSLLDRTVMIRTTQPAVTVRSNSSARMTRGLRTLHAAEDEIELDVPVHGRAGLLAHVLVLTGARGPLPHGHLDALDAATSLVRAALDDPALPALPGRDDVLGDLLSDDATARRAALSVAIEQRWVRRGAGMRIHAVRVDAAVSTVMLVALGRRLSTSRHLPFASLGVRKGTLYLVSVPTTAPLEDAILAEAAGHGIRVLGIGSASPSAGAEDLEQAAYEASCAAELSATFDEFQPGVDVSALGGWLLLASSAAEPSQLKVISPAAHALYFEGSEYQRRTIETYLDVSGNVVTACGILFIHRTTLYYRLEKMPPVVRDALADGMKRSTLHLALKLIRMWEATGRL
ncbi:helix-turn-helix domain-containing protein [Microbacterium sp. cx-55]|uniref:helix-turn-helix domain-containing protein n=1 Tax=Microbacterium sp. cx-55 TaxID=2875948 RepID=UPI001CBA9BB2|nr:PucR family transcriptional regulator [Microbacterium sp. cx-55]UGB35880.1 helix-turn-helix domain-containing protein [Microbacterium sp. cx-55]